MEEINELIRTAVLYSYVGDLDKALVSLLEGLEVGLETFASNKAAPELAPLYMKLIKIYYKQGNGKKEKEYLSIINDCHPEQSPATNAELTHFVTDLQAQSGLITKEEEYKQVLLSFKVFQKYDFYTVQGINIAFHLFLLAIEQKHGEEANEAVEWINEAKSHIKINGDSELELKAIDAVEKHLETITDKIQEDRNLHPSMFEDSFEDIGEL